MLDIFDILGPVMVGPSSSHTAGAVRIGRMARTLLGGAPVKADIGLYGSFAETGRGHGTDRALVAGVLGMRPDDLRIPQSFELAKEEGLDFYIHPIQLREAHPNTVVLKLRRADGNELMLQAASVGGGRIRVDKLNGVEVQFTGDLNTLVVQLSLIHISFFSVDTLEYLRKGGRIGKVTATAGMLLQIKPILTFAEDGQLTSVAKVRGRNQVIDKLVELAVKACGDHRRYNLAVANGGAPEGMALVREKLTAALPNYDHIWEGEIDGTLSVYIGDGVLGAAVQVLPDEEER